MTGDYAALIDSILNIDQNNICIPQPAADAATEIPPEMLNIYQQFVTQITNIYRV